MYHCDLVFVTLYLTVKALPPFKALCVGELLALLFRSSPGLSVVLPLSVGSMPLSTVSTSYL